MAAVDVVIVLLAIGALLLGWSRGFLVGASTLVGFILGLVLGRLLAGPVAELLVSTDIVHDRSHPAAEVLLPLLLAVACSVGLGLLGAYLRTRLTSPSGRGLDATGGALSSVIATLLVIWLAAGWIRTTPFLQPNRWVADSATVAAMDRMLPITSTEALGTLGTALADNGFPQVFEGQRERIRGVGEPNPAMVDVGRQVDGSVVKVVTSRTECGRLQEGTGWVYGDGLVATNAHVVAGAQSLTVQIAGTGEPYSAEVVAFDPGTDAAVLRGACPAGTGAGTRLRPRRRGRLRARRIPGERAVHDLAGARARTALGPRSRHLQRGQRHPRHLLGARDRALRQLRRPPARRRGPGGGNGVRALGH